jgi:hypothetical protein
MCIACTGLNCLTNTLLQTESALDEKTTRDTHWSFWAIVLAGLVFNLMGCANFISQMSAEMVASMPEAIRAIVETRPAWATGAFAIAVFGGAVGAVLLLLKKSSAYYVLIASLVGAVGAQIPFFGVEGFPVGATIGWVSQLVVGAFLVWYAKWAERRGWVG